MPEPFTPLADIPAVVGDINDDGVAVVGIGANDPEFTDPLAAAVREASQEVNGELGVVILDWNPESPGEMRDFSQQVLNNSDVSTVVVRSPLMSGTTSEMYSRASLEGAQRELMEYPDYPEGIEHFGAELSGAGSNWTAIAVVLVAFIIATLAASWWFARRLH